MSPDVLISQSDVHKTLYLKMHTGTNNENKDIKFTYDIILTIIVIFYGQSINEYKKILSIFVL